MVWKYLIHLQYITYCSMIVLIAISGLMPRHALVETIHTTRTAKLLSCSFYRSAVFHTVHHKMVLQFVTQHVYCYYRRHRGDSHLLHADSSSVSQSSVLFCSSSIPALLVRSYPPMGSHTTAMLMTWMTGHKMKLNPVKTELLHIPGDAPPCQDLVISQDNSQNSLSATAGILVLTMDNQLSFLSHIAKMAYSCWLVLYNIRGIRPFISTEATPMLVQSLLILKLDYCNSHLEHLFCHLTFATNT